MKRTCLGILLTIAVLAAVPTLSCKSNDQTKPSSVTEQSASTGASPSEIVARTQTGQWIISVIAVGDSWNETCALNLVAETYQLKREISLKRPNVKCALFGPIQVTATAKDLDSTLVFFEAAHGGDGDHSGPIIEVFKLTKQGFQKLGEQEMFDASYQRKN
jgi:hypothetical protein